jgi:hypothetical protein
VSLQVLNLWYVIVELVPMKGREVVSGELYFGAES